MTHNADQQLTKLWYNSSQERIEAVAGDDYASSVVVYRPLAAPVDPATRRYSQTVTERRDDALAAMSRFVQENPTITEGSDGQCWRVDYCEVVLPVKDFVMLWLDWYFGDMGYIEPGHALWERTAGGAPMKLAFTNRPYTFDMIIADGAYVPTPAYYAMVAKQQAQVKA